MSRLILGKVIEDEDIRVIAGARCWVIDGYIVKAKKVREVTGRTVAWRAETHTVAGTLEALVE